jgi:hypothetical protein
MAFSPALLEVQSANCSSVEQHSTDEAVIMTLQALGQQHRSA